MKLFPEVQDVFVDATERRVQRPQDNTKQKRLYSGKKNSYKKNNSNE